jgi:hypothetical protein
MKPAITGCERKLARKPSRKTPEQDQEGARQEGQRDGGKQQFGRPRFGDVSDRRRSHQRDHRHRPDGQRPAGAEDGVEHDRRDRGIDPGLGRQAGQQRIGERLRDQHDGDDHGRNEVVA